VSKVDSSISPSGLAVTEPQVIFVNDAELENKHVGVEQIQLLPSADFVVGDEQLGEHDVEVLQEELIQPEAALAAAKALIADGEFGPGLFMIADHLQPYFTGISADDINEAFFFDSNMDGDDSLACRESYAQMMLDFVLKVPVGPEVIRQIVIKCRENRLAGGRHPSCVTFTSSDAESEFFLAKGGDGAINVKWNVNAHETMDWVMLVREGDVANADSIGFVAVTVPSVLVLAHELGHFLYFLDRSRSKNVSTKPRKQTNKLLLRHAKADHDKIFRDVIANASKEKNMHKVDAKNRFKGCWNHDNDLDIVIAFQTATTVICYSDSRMIREAFECNLEGLAFKKLDSSALENYGQIVNGWRAVHHQMFIRFGYEVAGLFGDEFNALGNDEAKAYFKEIVENMLGKVTKEDGTAMSIADLPSVPLQH
jgi:hypothetical protein